MRMFQANKKKCVTVFVGSGRSIFLSHSLWHWSFIENVHRRIKTSVATPASISVWPTFRWSLLKSEPCAVGMGALADIFEPWMLISFDIWCWKNICVSGRCGNVYRWTDGRCIVICWFAPTRGQLTSRSVQLVLSSIHFAVCVIHNAQIWAVDRLNSTMRGFVPQSISCSATSCLGLLEEELWGIMIWFHAHDHMGIS